MTYQPGIPTGTVPLNQDYLNIQGNFTSLNTQWQVDHVPLTTTGGSPPNGYHTQVHLVPQSTPLATSGYGQVYSNTVNDGINTDQTLFFLTGGNRNLQLTRNFVPVSASNGYTFLPGGLILQWGLVNGTHGGDNHFNGGDSSSVTFATSNIAFPNNCFTVWAHPMYTTGNPPASSSSATVAIDRGFTRLSFNWSFASGSGSYTRFFWFAIGN
jgi:hypothetical protein